jgi:RNA polymerase sigma-70 factor (ECF subfamily)
MSQDFLNNPTFLAELRRDMLRFANMQLRDQGQAEDAVQEALAGALLGKDRFDSRASVRTWVLSILKNKIVDELRRRIRERTIIVENENYDDLDVYFDPRDHWSEESKPSTWASPQQAMENKRFWEVFDACLYRLPEASARIFTMREVLGFETDEICQTLGITTNNCWVQMHRARLALRACLEANWFGEAA